MTFFSKEVRGSQGMKSIILIELHLSLGLLPWKRIQECSVKSRSSQYHFLWKTSRTISSRIGWQINSCLQRHQLIEGVSWITQSTIWFCFLCNCQLRYQSPQCSIHRLIYSAGLTRIDWMRKGERERERKLCILSMTSIWCDDRTRRNDSPGCLVVVLFFLPRITPQGSVVWMTSLFEMTNMNYTCRVVLLWNYWIDIKLVGGVFVDIGRMNKMCYFMRDFRFVSLGLSA